MGDSSRTDRAFRPSMMNLDPRVVPSLGVPVEPVALSPPTHLAAASDGSGSGGLTGSGKGFGSAGSRHAAEVDSAGFARRGGGSASGGVPIPGTATLPDGRDGGHAGGTTQYTGGGSTTVGGSTTHGTIAQTSLSCSTLTNLSSVGHVGTWAGSTPYLTVTGATSGSVYGAHGVSAPGNGGFLGIGQTVSSPATVGTTGPGQSGGAWMSAGPRPQGPFPSLRAEIDAYNGWLAQVSSDIVSYNRDVSSYNDAVFNWHQAIATYNSRFGADLSFKLTNEFNVLTNKDEQKMVFEFKPPTTWTREARQQKDALDARGQQLFSQFVLLEKQRATVVQEFDTANIWYSQLLEQYNQVHPKPR